MFTIKVDYREKQLYQYVEEKIKPHTHLRLVSENLPLGDVILYDTKGNEKVIIERKTMLDLANSIQDGRYKEQSYRLQQLPLHNHSIMFILEGKCSDYDLRYSRVKQSALYSSCISLFYFEGFSLFRTYNVFETAEFILRMALKLCKETKRNYFYESQKIMNVKTTGEEITPNENTMEINDDSSTMGNEENHSKSSESTLYSDVSSRVKKNNITPENIGEIILSQIPFISSSTARAIMRTFNGSLFNCIHNVKTNKDVLYTITYTASNGQVRRISKRAVENLIRFLGEKKIHTIEVS